MNPRWVCWEATGTLVLAASYSWVILFGFVCYFCGLYPGIFRILLQVYVGVVQNSWFELHARGCGDTHCKEVKIASGSLSNHICAYGIFKGF